MLVQQPADRASIENNWLLTSLLVNMSTWLRKLRSTQPSASLLIVRNKQQKDFMSASFYWLPNGNQLCVSSFSDCLGPERISLVKWRWSKFQATFHPNNNNTQKTAHRLDWKPIGIYGLFFVPFRLLSISFHAQEVESHWKMIIDKSNPPRPGGV